MKPEEQSGGMGGLAPHISLAPTGASCGRQQAPSFPAEGRGLDLTSTDATGLLADGANLWAWAFFKTVTIPVPGPMPQRHSVSDGDSVVDYSGHCTSPVLAGRQGATVLLVRCRKCSSCHAYRGWVWARRAAANVACSPRTWFVTLTLNPYAREYFAREAYPEWSGGLVYEAGSKWARRFVRKEKGTKWFLVLERHSDGQPHLHCLLHVPRAITKRSAEATAPWRFGFTRYQLVNPGHPSYMAKYIAKDMRSRRIRASKGYGDALKCVLNTAEYSGATSQELAGRTS